jgi:pentatricopeptide repeat protein
MTLVDLNLEAACDDGTASLYPSQQLDASCFNVVMNAYSKLKTGEGDERVRQLYALMSSASKTLPYLVPDDNSNRTFLESATFELADSTLRDIVARADISGSRIPLSFFASVLNKWATSGHHIAGERAEQVLRLQQTYSKRDPSAALSTISYNVVIKGIFRTPPIDADSAKRLLEEMVQNADRNPIIQPDQVTYNTVMNCYQRRGNPGDDQCCLSILRNMIERGTAPNVVSISICMDALRNSKRPDRVEQTEVLLHLYQQKYNKNSSSPNLFLLTLKVLNETDGGPEHMLKAMELFKEAAFTGSLTPDFFAMMINICNKYGTNPKVRVTTIRKIMIRCVEVGMVSRSSLDSFRDAVSPNVFREVLKIPLAANIAQVQVGHFPDSWKRPMTPAKQSLLFREASARSGGQPDSIVDGTNA